MNREELEKTSKFMSLNIQLFAEQSNADNDDSNNESDENNDKEESSKEEKKELEKKYTDDDVNNISKKNSEKAVKKLMKDLGIDDVEEAKSILANARAEKEKNKTAEDKANELSNNLSDKDKKLTERTEKLATALLENALIREGVESSRIARATSMIKTSNVLNEDGDVDSDLIKSEIEKLLKEFPEFKKRDKEETNKGFKFGSDGKQDTGKAKETTTPVKRWNRFNH